MGGRATTSGARSLALPLLALFKPSFVLLFFLSSAVSSGLAGSRIADGVLLPAGQDRSRSAPPQIKPGVGHFGEGSHGLNISRTFLANSASTSLHSSSTGPSRSAAARLSSVHSVAPSSTPLSPSSLLRGSKASRSAFPSFSSLRKEKLSTSSAEKQGIVDNSFEDEGLEGRARKPRAPPAVDESLIDLSGHSDTPEMSPSAGVNDVLAPARILNPKQFARQLVAKVHTAFVQRDQRIAEDQKDGKENVEKERRQGSSALLGVDEQLKQADHGDVAADDGETGEIDVNEAEALIPDEESVGRSVFLQDAREFEDDDGKQDDDADDVSSSHDIRARDAHTFAFVQNTDQTEKEEAEGSSQEDDDMVGSNEETGSKSKSEGGDASEKEEKSEKGDTSERGDKSEKEDTTEKEEKSENGDTSERGDKSENGDTSEKEDQSGKGDTSQQGDKSEKEEKSEAADKSEADTSKNSSSAKAGADVLLQHHHLGQGGPRGRTAVTSHSHMHVQDVTQHHQLQEATQMAGKLTRHLQIQNSLKLREMFLKRKEVGHLNLLKHFQDLMQAVVSRIYSKLKGAKRSLKRMYSHSRSIIKRFLHETDHKVVRPEELPSAVLTPPDEGNVLGKTTNGIVMDCPTDCNPAACDNKPVEPAQCFKYEAVAGGGGFRRCEPFADPLTATCGKGFTRCAMAAPTRGKHYQMFASPPDHPLPQPLLIQGSNLHACLRLLPVHQATRCSPESAETVEAALKDTQAVAQQPPPHVLEQAVLFENIQVPMPGSYKLCMLQYWRPPDSKPTDNVFIMGIDEIGTLDVLQQPDAETLKHVQGLHKKDSQMH